MNVQELVINDSEQVSLEDIVLEEAGRAQLVQLIKEHRFIEALTGYGLPVNNKVLLAGSSGCGKTMTAKAVAKTLGKKILILNLSNVVCARIGETSQNMKAVVEKAGREKAVLFLDEFDQLGKSRDTDDKDVGEMRRVVNTLIQLIDYYPPNALLLCATNYPSMIDTALLRRFQLRIHFEMPSPERLNAYYDRLLSCFPVALQHIERIYEISYAEAKDHVFTHIKAAVIRELEEAQKQ
ncbi:ATP-binding protein [Niabella pedocola]|uniref:ATP-binding protein n=1 Tax=Niabella pedocola TaxID=1752077 RepID=A0ABS8PJ49_9BACT|nr:ATP-binding protein [Niabella pedocola]MCD2421139.1 ATP-binding protein [Niabella pedocola]